LLLTAAAVRHGHDLFDLALARIAVLWASRSLPLLVPFGI
jgi:hypothetical protein